MKVWKFHQFVFLERGPVNTAIVDFLKGDVYQIKNSYLEHFYERKYQRIKGILEFLKKEKLIISIEENRWVPYIEIKPKEEEFENIELEIEEGVDLAIVKSIIETFGISKITYYGKTCPLELRSLLKLGVKLERKTKNFKNCIQINHIEGEFGKVELNFYKFNMIFNTCWGKKSLCQKTVL